MSENLHRIDPEVIGQIDGSPLTIAGLYQALLAIINECSFQVYGDGDEADVDHIRDIALNALTGYVYNDVENSIFSWGKFHTFLGNSTTSWGIFYVGIWKIPQHSPLAFRYPASIE